MAFAAVFAMSLARASSIATINRKSSLLDGKLAWPLKHCYIPTSCPPKALFVKKDDTWGERNVSQRCYLKLRKITLSKLLPHVCKSPSAAASTSVTKHWRRDLTTAVTCYFCFYFFALVCCVLFFFFPKLWERCFYSDVTKPIRKWLACTTLFALPFFLENRSWQRGSKRALRWLLWAAGCIAWVHYLPDELLCYSPCRQWCRAICSVQVTNTGAAGLFTSTKLEWKLFPTPSSATVDPTQLMPYTATAYFK